MEDVKELRKLVNSLQGTFDEMSNKYETLLGEAIQDSMDKQRKVSGITMSFIVTKWIEFLTEDPKNVNKVISDMRSYLTKVDELFDSDEERDQMMKDIWGIIEKNYDK